jgi:hypothetical protein
MIEVEADSGFYIQNIYWVVLRGKTESSPSDAIVSGVAFFRNKLGDAHGQNGKNELLLNEFGELSVNLAGSICTFLIKAFEKNTTGAKTTPLHSA